MTRAGWKYWYRQMRIVRRETEKACLDMLLYGSSFMRIDLEGLHHIPFRNVHFRPLLKEPPPFKPPSPQTLELLESLKHSLDVIHRTPPR